jgi:hypothetical protein
MASNLDKAFSINGDMLLLEFLSRIYGVKTRI